MIWIDIFLFICFVYIFRLSRELYDQALGNARDQSELYDAIFDRLEALEDGGKGNEK